jgi:uncharacterized membrane protein YraQ (UPF0718 family)
MEQITYILNFILKSFISVWPYLLVTIPLAVWVNLSDFSKQFKTVMTKSPWLAIILATAVGAFSPFCSCGVIPVILALLIGGVPLAPVFAFWVASPSMDPEIFFLSVSILGWKLAVWRLASTFCLSLLAGIITHLLVKSGYLTTYLRIIKKSCECSSTGTTLKELPLRKKIIRESVISVLMISKFMGLAFFLNALINLYVPEEWIGNLLNQQGFVSVIIASVLGVPIYTSNLTALPLVGGLLQLGLNPEAALAFLISGPLTTIPAMVAVYGITTRKVFGLYIFIALFGSLFFGILYYFLG